MGTLVVALCCVDEHLFLLAYLLMLHAVELLRFAVLLQGSSSQTSSTSTNPSTRRQEQT
jgi:hypothetical protein